MNVDYTKVADLKIGDEFIYLGEIVKIRHIATYRWHDLDYYVIRTENGDELDHSELSSLWKITNYEKDI